MGFVRYPILQLIIMSTSPKMLTPPPIATQAFVDAPAAVARLTQIYERNTAFLRNHFEAYANGQPLDQRVRATYPFVRITTSTYARLDSRLSFGFVTSRERIGTSRSTSKS